MKNLPKLLHEWTQAVWGAALFTLPFGIYTTLWQNPYFIGGAHNTFTEFSLYLSEVLIGIAFALWIGTRVIEDAPKMKKEESKLWKLCGIILLLSLISIFFSQNRTSSWFAEIHILAGLMVVILTAKKILSLKLLQQILIASASLQGGIAILQVLNQGSLELSFLGESMIGPDIAGVAKVNIGGKTFMRGYGTLPHANILAGYLLVSIFFLKGLYGKMNSKWWTVCAITILGGFVAAFSKGAIFAVLIALLVLKKTSPKTRHVTYASIGGIIILMITMMIGLGVKSGNQEWFSERLEYIGISTQMLMKAPQGVGLNQFTERMQEFTIDKLQPWQLQPVHNIYLLVANEWGIWSGLILIYAIGWMIKDRREQDTQIALIAGLATIGLFDHYLISLFPGLMLLAISIGTILPQPKNASPKAG